MSVLSLRAARAGVVAVAAASALALLALPSAAHAAEVVTCTPQVTAASQPWLTFSQSENFYEPFAAAFGTFVTTSADLTNDFPESFTADDLDEYEQDLTAASETLAAALEGIADSDGAEVLATQLAAADPDNTTGWQEKLAALDTEFEQTIDASGYAAALQSFGATLTAFSEDAEAIVDADVPAGGPFDRPEIPATLNTDVDTVLAALPKISAAFQTIILDGAAAYVVYEDVCVTTTVADPAAVVAPKTLAATGNSDGIALGTIAGALLLIGAATTVMVRRRTA